MDYLPCQNQENKKKNQVILGTFSMSLLSKYLTQQLYLYLGVSLNGDTPKTPQNDHC